MPRVGGLAASWDEVNGLGDWEWACIVKGIADERAWNLKKVHNSGQKLDQKALPN